jgi:uncharacterized protein YkwD
MKNALLCLLLLVTGVMAAVQSSVAQSDGLKPAGLQSEAWDESMYDTFSQEDFERYRPSGMEIDLSDVDYPLLHAAVFYETNSRRNEHGVPVFLHLTELEQASFLHSRDMVEKGFFSHENPYDPGRRTPWHRMAAFGVDSGYIAENITEAFGIRYEPGSPVIIPDGESTEFRDYESGEAIGTHTYRSFAESVVESWMQSPPHRANILDPALRYLGCGAYHYKNASFHGMHQFKVTQNFSSAKPLQ